jgi:hypothetical protein
MKNICVISMKTFVGPSHEESSLIMSKRVGVKRIFPDS